MTKTALDIEAAGNDRAGIIDGYAAALQIMPALGTLGLVVLVSAIAVAGTRPTQ